MSYPGICLEGRLYSLKAALAVPEEAPLLLPPPLLSACSMGSWDGEVAVKQELPSHSVMWEKCSRETCGVIEELAIRDAIRTVITLRWRAKGLIQHFSQPSGNYWVLQLIRWLMFALPRGSLPSAGMGGPQTQAPGTGVPLPLMTCEFWCQESRLEHITPVRKGAV